MRRFQIATISLTATLTLAVAGCRQTTSTVASGPLAPLAPSNPSNTPTFSPFGGQTRVTPPPTGSYSVPNNYLGGAVPMSQNSNPPAGVGGIAGVPNGSMPATGGFGVANVANQPIGSGVRQTGWTETGTSVASPNGAAIGNGVASPNGFAPSGVAPAGYQPTAPVAPARDPRAGGMQIIDLTSAPMPPGYGGPFLNRTGMLTPANGPNGWGAGQNVAPVQYTSPAPTATPTQPGPSFRSISSPSPNNLTATTANPAGQLSQVPGFNSRQSEVPAGAASSQLTPVDRPPTLGQVNRSPVAADSSTQQASLPWRRPGAQF